MILVVGDKRRLTYRLRKAGRVFDLTGKTLTWKLRKPDLTTITEAMTILVATDGTAWVDPLDGASASHFTLEGWYDVEVLVTQAGVDEYPERPARIFVRAEYTEAEA